MPNDPKGANTAPSATPERARGSGAERRVLGAGSLLFKQGDDGNEAFLIQEGRIELSIRASNDRRVVLNELSRGDLLGEMALIGGGPRLATAAALTDVVLLVITRAEFDTRLSSMDPVMRRVLAALTDKLRAMSERHVDELAKIR